MKIWTTLLAVGLLTFSALLVVALTSGNAGSAMQWLLTDTWGRVTSADLLLGFTVFSAFVWMREPNRGTALAWIVPVFVLGNVVGAVYLLTRVIPAHVRARA